jgi:hypothetical protein
VAGPEAGLSHSKRYRWLKATKMQLSEVVTKQPATSMESFAMRQVSGHLSPQKCEPSGILLYNAQQPVKLRHGMCVAPKRTNAFFFMTRGIM